VLDQQGIGMNSSHSSVDYVYFETSPSMPYQIRRIEELNKVSRTTILGISLILAVCQAVHPRFFVIYGVFIVWMKNEDLRSHLFVDIGNHIGWMNAK